MITLLGANRIHFIVIGGIGMSGLAQLCCARGLTVSGSDVSVAPLLRRLRAAGATIHSGHAPEHVGGAELVVRSTAIPDENPEWREARARGVRVVHRSQLLEALMADRRAVAVSGTHGKSTTTAMIARILMETGRDPGVTVGAEMSELGDAHLPRGNARAGLGDWFVAEADESDGSFLRCAPEISVVTNIEADHLDHWRDERELVTAFQQFVQQTKPGGRVVL
jgi:UDP-N-acetylmuramate--alanine ligase